MPTLNISIPGIQKVLDGISSVNDLSRQAERHTISDIKARANTWVAQAVNSIYTINKNQIKWDKAKKDPAIMRKAGKILVKGDTIDNISLTYRGNLLSPIRFKMTPSAPTGNDYNLSMEVYKGKRKTIGRYKTRRTRGGLYAESTGGILMPTGAKSVDKAQYIPFKRQSKSRKDIIPFKTVSIPQMINNPTVRERIQKALAVNVNKRLKHNIDRLSKQGLTR
jgi:hypothetical protein